MKHAKTLGLALLLGSVVVTGCTQQTPKTPPGNDKKPVAKKMEEHASHGEGPNGGVVFDLGKYHAEFTVDHPAKKCFVLFIDGDNKDAKPLAVAATEFTLTTKETKTAEGKIVEPMTIKMLPENAKDGKASKFVGADPGIGNVADFAGTVIGKINGKPAKGEFEE